MEAQKLLLARIREYTTSHGIDIENEFREYDRRRTGLISATALHRCISDLGLTVLTDQIKMLESSYQTQGGIDIRRLVQDMREAPRPEELAFTAIPQCLDELRILADELCFRRITLREAVRQFDTLNTGRIPSDGFFRIFGMTKPMRVIVRSFGNHVTGELDYFRIENALRQTGLLREIPHDQLSRPELPRSFATFVRVVRERAIDLRLMFSQSDRSRLGKLAPRQFASVLGAVGADLPSLEIEKITRCFIDDDGMCSYDGICRAVDEYQLPPTPSLSRKEVEVEKPVTPEDVLQKVRMIIADRRIDPREFFTVQTCDGATELITRSRFGRILSAMRLDLTNEEIDNLVILFGGPANTVNYPKFVRSLVKENEKREVNVDDVLNRLKEHLRTTKQCLADRAYRFDMEGSGEISFVQLGSVIQSVNFPITPHELVAIRDEFAGAKYDGVRWHDLCRRVDPTPKETGPTVSDLQRAAIRTQVDTPSFSLPPESVRNIVLRISQVCEQKSINLSEELMACDRRNDSVLPREQFIDILGRLPMTVTPSDMRVLVAYYRVSGTPSIDYVRFCRDSLELLKVEAEEAAKPKPAPSPPASPKVPRLPLHVRAFIQRYKQFIELIGKDSQAPFEPWDRNGTGYVHVSKVADVFRRVEFAAGRDEIESITREFCDSRRNEWFNYKLFAYVVDRENLSDRSPRQSLSPVTIPRNFAMELATTVGSIRNKLMTSHRPIRLAFAGVRGDTVAKDEFSRRLETMDIVLSSDQTEAIVKRYGLNTSDRVDWNAFCRDVENATIGF